MDEAFNSQSNNIGELLGGNQRARLVVPQFQRGYSWEKKHVEVFWADITTFQKESAVKGGPEKYFLGPIVTLTKSKQIIQLLDGQQRLATATILFAVLRDVARGLKISAATDFARDTQVQLIVKETGKYSLDMGEMDALYFAETIQADPPVSKKPTIRSHRNIQKARQFLFDSVKARIATLDPARAIDVLRDLRQTIRSDLVMASIPVASERDAFRIFETLNDRGLRLSVPDLLLNYLMRVAKDPERRQIRDSWNEMLEQMGRRDINRFLRHMWVSKYGDLKNQDLFTALKEHIEKNSIGSLEFTRACADECTSYVQLLDIDEKQLGKSTPHVRNLLRDLDVQSALPMLLSSFRLLDAGEFQKVARWLLVFVTRYSVIQNLDSSGLETVLFKLAREIRNTLVDTDAKTVKNCIAYIKETLKKNAPPNDQIILAVQGLVVSADEARYLLTRVATRMQTSTKEIKIDEINLEHVFPKNPGDEWKDKENLEPFLWHLGNLTMLGERLNRDAANRGFSFKRSHYYQKSELTMVQQIAADHKIWDRAAIEDRAKKLAPFIAEIWNFDNPSRV